MQTRTAGSELVERVDTLRLVLDHVNANVFVADRNFELVYMNAKARRTTQELESALNDAYGLTVRDLMFGSIHRFHRDPARVEAALRSASVKPHRAKLKFSDAVLDATFLVMRHPDSGEPMGYVVTWHSVGERDAAAAQLTSELEATSSRLLDVSAMLQEAAATVADDASSVAAGAEELAASVHEVSRSAHEAATVASTAVQLTTASRATVESLAASSAEIGNAVKLISDVAAQTNLLALNATIEAARSGEAGRGFAVVAHEVKELANQTKAAANQIVQWVNSMTEDVTATVGTLDEIGTVIARIDDLQASIAAAVEQQAVTTTEMSARIQRVAESSHSTSSAASSITGMGTDLDEQISTLHRLLGN